MKHYSHILITLAISALVWPLQSCANSGTKAEAHAEEPTAESVAEPVEEVVADFADISAGKQPDYRIFIEGLLMDARKRRPIPASRCSLPASSSMYPMWPIPSKSTTRRS